jgi:hypothetical protein
MVTLQAIYDHSGKARKELFPGGPDGYRYNTYVRDDENKSFHVHQLKPTSIEKSETENGRN